MTKHKIQTFEELVAALTSNPDHLLGLEECSWLDFKESPYQLDTDKGKLDLAKDVSSFANADGGAIVLGVDTRRDDSLAIEVAETIKPIPSGLVVPDSIGKIVHDTVYPRVDVRVMRFAVPGTTGSIWVIHVPKTTPISFPHIVAKAILTPNGRPSQYFFSVYRRHEDRNAPFIPGEVWSWMNRAFNAPSIREAEDNKVGSSPKEDDSALDDDRAAVRSNVGESLYVLQIVPTAQSQEEIDRFYDGDPDSLQSALPKFRPLREHGFRFPVRRNTERSTDGSLRVAIQGHSSISVSRRGHVTAVASQELLTWATAKSAPTGQAWINPLALVEFTFETCRLWNDIVRPKIKALTAIKWRCGIEQVKGETQLMLPRKPLSGSAIVFGSSTFASSGADFLTDWKSVEAVDSGTLAFMILVEAYRWFGLGREFVPYSLNGRIEPELIARL